MTPAALLLFGKVPSPGRVKTRLARRLGERPAAALAGAFLQDAAARYGGLADAEPVLAADPDPADEFWHLHFGPPWRIEPQGAGDLGERLARAFRREFQRSERVCALGADHPALPLDLLAAFLGETAAIWPTRDGGYAAIVLSRNDRSEDLFRGIPWSSDRVLEETLTRAEGAAIPLAVYPETYDVDQAEDLDRLEDDLRSRDRRAADFPRHTWQTLEEIRRTRRRG